MALNKSKNNDSNRQMLAYHKAKIEEKNQQIASLEQQLNTLKNHNHSILHSYSFRLGAVLTWPLRFLQGLLSPSKPQQSSIVGSCDAAYAAAGYLEISGWALSNHSIEKVEVFADGNLIGEAELGIYRDDVHDSFPQHPHSKSSGYYCRLKTTLDHGVLKIKIYDNKYCIELKKVIIPSIKDMTINAQYQIFLQQNQFTPNVIQKLKSDMTNWDFQPLISLIVPVYNVESKWLDLCIESLLNQWYEHWQLCLYDDCSSSIETQKCLCKWQGSDSRITIDYGQSNQGIAMASNAAIDLAEGEYIGLLDHDDELTPDALFHVVQALNDQPGLDFIYSDEDKIDESGQYCDPHFKSDFNLSALLSHNYICHFSVIKKSIGDSIGWFRSGYEGSQDHDLFLRVCLHTNNIYHIARVLYHWRKIPGSTAVSIDNKSYAQKSAQKSIMDYLKMANISAHVEPGLFTNSFRVKPLLSTQSLVSIIIPFRDELNLLKACIDSILTLTDYPNYEVLLIDNQSQEAVMSDYLTDLSKRHKNIHVHVFDEPFNYAKMNNWATQQANGQYLLFLNNDMQIINQDWLSAMLEQVQFTSVAAVGAKLLYPDNTIQHAGIVISAQGATHINKNLADLATGYQQRANYVQNISACTAACLLVDHSVFQKIGGFDESHFSIAYNDVDLCLRIRQAGYLITYTPYAKLYHFESQSRGLDDNGEKRQRFEREINSYQSIWADIYKNGDPYFNPNFTQDREQISLKIEV